MGFAEKIRRKKRLWSRENRGLLTEMIAAVFKIEDRNSVLGILWSLLGPAVLLGIMYMVFSAHFGQKTHAYPLYLLIGIVSINYFITATTYLMTVFANSRSLIFDSTVPRENLMIASLFRHTYKFILELLICAVLSLFYGVFDPRLFLLSIPLVAVFVTFVMGIGLILALMHCFARDVQHLWMIVSRVLFFATPIFYSANDLSPIAQKCVYYANPLTPFLLCFQDIFLGRDLSGWSYLYSLFFGRSCFCG